MGILEQMREFVDKAGAGIQEIGEKGVLLLEIQQLSGKYKDACFRLGEMLASEIEEHKSDAFTLSAAVMALYADIKRLESELKVHRDKLSEK